MGAHATGDVISDGDITVTLDGIETNITVEDGIAEISSLQITSAPTTAGDVTITLDGTGTTTVPVDIGTAEAASIQITAAPTAVGDVTVTLDGVGTTIAVDPAIETTAIAVADKIRGTAFTGWIVSGTSGTDLVTFTSNTVGGKTDTTYVDGGTGATGISTTTTQGEDADTIIVVADKIRATTFTGWVTGGTVGTDTVTFTSNTKGTKTDSTYNAGTTGATGVMTTTTQGINADTATDVATKIRETSFTDWTTGGSTTNITFTSNTTGVKTDATFSANSTGVTGSINTTTQGVDDTRTIYDYYIIAEDINGFQTLSSPAGSITNGNPTLDITNYNTISWAAVNGAVKYHILKTNTSTKIGETSNLTIDDQGQATSAFTYLGRNNTADLDVSGRVKSENREVITSTIEGAKIEILEDQAAHQALIDSGAIVTNTFYFW